MRRRRPPGQRPAPTSAGEPLFNATRPDVHRWLVAGRRVRETNRLRLSFVTVPVAKIEDGIALIAREIKSSRRM